ncbi:MAG: TonB-dependent receptor, partial [Bacteroidales bacterium]|nr:TonB-dependent receptor [Bacteroidales bacterium]
MREKKNIFFISLFLLCLNLFGQEKATIYGKITNEQDQNIDLVNISILGLPGGTITNKFGKYEIEVPANKDISLVFSYLGYKTETIKLHLKPGERKNIDKKLQPAATDLPDFEVRDNQINKSSITRINPKNVGLIPSIADGIPALLKTLPGVSSSNELSSQYSVRGGNFDENLVYVNGIEVYRPILVRSGQQEGLGFVNSDLVSSIVFSAGGFDAKYGDKMASVLDIKYKKPSELAGSVSLSLLGASFHIEGTAAKERLTYLLGVRHKTNQYVLNSLETKGDYKPSFTDIQTLVTYGLSKKLEISFLGNYARNSYKLIPSDRETDFGTLMEAHRLKVYFDGQEVDMFKTYFGAVSVAYQPHKSLRLSFTTSAFQTIESETFDIQGQYWIGLLETGFGDEEFGDVVEQQGVGTFLNHGRNYLDASVFNFQHKGNYEVNGNLLQWGFKLQHEIISDKNNEWEMLDSAGYALPHYRDYPGYTTNTSGDSIIFYDTVLQKPNYSIHFPGVIRADTSISSNRVTAFIQNTWNFDTEKSQIFLSGGVRLNYWDLNKQFLISPRLTLSIKPESKRDIIFRFSSGYYYQPPFFKELRDLEGNIHTDVKAQKSIHFVAGSDLNFLWGGRPFKFITELYYKYLDDLIPYEVDNVRIRYTALNNSHGYATGIDFKINGEFVRGIESWASMSFMLTKEDIEGDFYYKYTEEGKTYIIDGNSATEPPPGAVKFEPGYIPRPTDQRFNFSLFFQDYLPKNPSYKMHLTL